MTECIQAAVNRTEVEDRAQGPSHVQKEDGMLKFYAGMTVFVNEKLFSRSRGRVQDR